MSPKVAGAVIVLALGLAAGAWFYWGPKPVETPVAEATDETPETVSVEQEVLPATVYLLGLNGLLQGSNIEAPAEDGEARIRAVVEALLTESEPGAELASPLPPGTQLAGVFFVQPSVVALDFRLPTEMAMFSVGSKHEMLTVYSLVNSVVLNSDRIDSVVLMVNGRQPETLAGHVDLTRPLTADLSWISTADPDATSES